MFERYTDAAIKWNFYISKQEKTMGCIISEWLMWLYDFKKLGIVQVENNVPNVPNISFYANFVCIKSLCLKDSQEWNR